MGREPTGPAKLMFVEEVRRREAMLLLDRLEKVRPSESCDRRSSFFRVPRARPIRMHDADADACAMLSSDKNGGPRCSPRLTLLQDAGWEVGDG
jgi:hypothetical protein